MLIMLVIFGAEENQYFSKSYQHIACSGAGPSKVSEQIPRPETCA
jgi:hypothetical protein